MFFDNSYSRNVADFQLEDGTCEFLGPFKHAHLRFCAEDCKDYETFAEA